MTKWLSPKPTKCDLCYEPLESIFVDGKTQMGPWVIMCGHCFIELGCGIGTGQGQMYDLDDLEQLDVEMP